MIKIQLALSQLIKRLQDIEADPNLLELHQVSIFEDVLPALTTVPSLKLADLLLQWRQDYPNDSYLLLQAIVASSMVGQLAESFARRLSCWDDDAEYVDVILAASKSRLE